MTRTRVVLATIFASVLLAWSGASASAADSVGVAFDVTLADSHSVASCSVSVASGANGVAVLDAAVADGCIDSYDTIDFGFGTFVDCINDICGRGEAIFVGTFWGLYFDDIASEVGVDGFVAGTSGSLGLDYQSYAFVPLP